MAKAIVHRLEGKMEKRFPMAIVVHLASVEEQLAEEAELTYTDNVSAHGACVISSRTWKPGELAELTSLKDGNALRGRVVHCQKRSEEHYAIGLNFPEQQAGWLKDSKSASS